MNKQCTSNNFRTKFIRSILLIFMVFTGINSLVIAGNINQQILTPGKGIFVKHRGDTIHSAVLENPYISGSWIGFYWSQLEPKEGQYNWPVIEKHLETLASVNKRAVLKIMTAGAFWWNKNAYSKQGTPEWVFQKGVPKIGIANETSVYPVFWDEQYQLAWQNFNRALAKKYDGDPRIEFIRIGGISQGTEPTLSGRDTKKLLKQWQAVGFNGFTKKGLYENTVLENINMFAETFKKTPLAVSIHFKHSKPRKRSMDENIIAHAIAKKCILLNNGLSVRVGSLSRKATQNYYKNNGVKVGWGGFGHDIFIEDKAVKRRLRQLSKNKPSKLDKKKIKALKKEIIATSSVKLIDVFKHGIGDDTDSTLTPKSYVSYLIVGDERMAAKSLPGRHEYDKNFEEAIIYANEQLMP